MTSQALNAWLHEVPFRVATTTYYSGQYHVSLWDYPGPTKTEPDARGSGETLPQAAMDALAKLEKARDVA